MSLHKQYYWPAMSSDVKNFIRSCDSCQRYKSSNALPTGLMADYERKFKPNMAYNLDVVGPLPMSKKKNRFIFTAVDMASRLDHCRSLSRWNRQKFSPLFLSAPNSHNFLKGNAIYAQPTKNNLGFSLFPPAPAQHLNYPTNRTDPKKKKFLNFGNNIPFPRCHLKKLDKNP